MQHSKKRSTVELVWSELLKCWQKN